MGSVYRDRKSYSLSRAVAYRSYPKRRTSSRRRFSEQHNCRWRVWGSYAETVTNAPAYNETSGTGETSSVETAVTSHYETDSLGVRVLVSSDGTYHPTNTFEKDGVIYTIAGIDTFYQIYGVDENGKTEYLDKQYYIGNGRTATSTGKRDETGHLIGIANDTGEEIKLNDWLLPNGIHAWYDRVNRNTGEVIVTDGIGEYTIKQPKIRVFPLV